MIGVAIQGAGNVSTEHIKAYERNPQSRIVAIGSRTLEGAKNKALQCNLSCDCFDSYDRLLEHPDVDLISICTPPGLHAAESIAAAEAGKHILIEKPVAVNTEELNAMDVAVRKAGVKTTVSFVLRWNPMVQSIRHAIDKGWIGRPSLVQADYWHGPTNAHPESHSNARWKALEIGAIVHSGCHAMDAARYILNNQEITQVTGVSPAQFDKPDAYRATTVATVRFEKGAVGKISGSTEFFMPYVFNLEVFGDEGVIRNNRFYTRNLPGQNDFASVPTILPDSGSVSHHPFQDLIDHLIECVTTNTESPNRLAVAINTHLACFAAEESASLGSQVIRLGN